MHNSTDYVNFLEKSLAPLMLNFCPISSLPMLINLFLSDAYKKKHVLLLSAVLASRCLIVLDYWPLDQHMYYGTLDFLKHL